MFNDVLNELKGFKYQITVEVLLNKYKLNGEIEFRPVYFNSVTKTVTNHIFNDVWINNGSAWIIELSLNTLILQLMDHYQEVLV